MGFPRARHNEASGRDSRLFSAERVRARKNYVGGNPITSPIAGGDVRWLLNSAHFHRILNCRSTGNKTEIVYAYVY